MAHRFRSALRTRRWDVVETAGENDLLGVVRDTKPQLVAIQARSTASILPFARRVHEAYGRAQLILIVRECGADLALSAMRAGVNDILTEFSTEAEIAEALDRMPHDSPPPPPKTNLLCGDRIVGHSESVEKLRQSLLRVAACDSNVLITGETGTGKELAAELIHTNSRRSDRPLVTINCAAIPDGLLESELFGYERGAFTGAHAAREGKLQYAQGGTLFLDEIGEMSLYAQAKILRVIESRKVQRLGGNRELAVNLRLIAATNQNLEQLTSQQKFRQDLYFRLNVARIQLAPLREHAEDIPDLVLHLVREVAVRMERPVEEVDPSFIEPLVRYAWPGNVRELRNVIESTLVFASSPRVTRRDLPPYLRALFATEERKRDSEREKIVGALRMTGWNRNDAARILGCSRMTLYRKMVRYELLSGESGPAERAVRPA